MADEYTPTTAEICQVWVKATPVSGPEGRAEFARWITAHDREVAAKALREAAEVEADWTSTAWRSEEAETVVKLRKGLRARADRIESQASEKGASDGEQ